MTQRFDRNQGQRGGPPPQQTSDPQLRAALVADDGAALDAVASRLAQGEVGGDLAKNAQVRRVFGEIRRIQSRLAVGDVDEAALRRQLVMLKFRARYAAGRDRNLAPLANLIADAVEITEGQPDRFGRFVDLMEALIAERMWAGQFGRGR